MYNKERENRRLYIASFADDRPADASGTLIPKRTLYTAPKNALGRSRVWLIQPVLIITSLVLLLTLGVATAGYAVWLAPQSVASPIVVVDQSEMIAADPLQYGIALLPSVSNEVAERKAELIAESRSFLEIDLTSEQITLWHSSTSSEQYQVIHQPETNSWWYMPAGIYAVDSMREREYSTFANLYLPYAVSFGGNIALNGEPEYRDSEPVALEYQGGGIRVETSELQRLFEQLAPGLPVLLNTATVAGDDFLYRAKVEGVHAGHYLVADIESNTVLAASDLHQAVPIASITKLMTALVAAEYIDLDRRVAIRSNPSNFVTSLVPRLQSSNSASMYSLLQLLLVESSNEAAEVIASVLGRGTFIELMNTKAAAIGLTNSSFTDPSGLDAGNVSSVHDLFRLVQYIENNRGFIMELTADQHLESAYTNGEFGVLANFNEIEEVGFIAGKIGETRAAGMTSVSLHTVSIRGEKREVVIVLLNTDERDNDVRRLVSFVEDRFE
ncbi:serine hydrolase [Candidatus Pacebacteria bacterium]|nr:serine hydrolase [Candidatus Paceibacterota bacterium]